MILHSPTNSQGPSIVDVARALGIKAHRCATLDLRACLILCAAVADFYGVPDPFEDVPIPDDPYSALDTDGRCGILDGRQLTFEEDAA